MSKSKKTLWNIEQSTGILNTSRIPNEITLQKYYNDLVSSEKFDLNGEKKELVHKAVKASIAALSCCSDKEHKNDTLIEIANNIFTTLKKNVVCDDNTISCICGNAAAVFKCINNDNYEEIDRLINNLKGSAEQLYQKLKNKKNVYTHSFINDYNRIVFSSSFRRLQDKAQVFSLEEHDYARTRLTHSIEVSSIASQLANLCALKIFKDNESKKKSMSFQMEKVLSCAALLHDIGNPPYGHYGEDIIKKYFKEHWEEFKYCRFIDDKYIDYISFPQISNKSMEQMKNDFTKFDGNAQSLRIASKLQLYKPGHSLDLTVAVLGAIIKYPLNSVNSKEEKFGYFYSESDVIHNLRALDVYKDGIRNPLVFLLEAADDISYVTSDFDDVVKKHVVTYEKFVHELEKINNTDNEVIAFKNNFIKFYDENKQTSDEAPFELTILRMTNDLRIQLINEVVDVYCNNEIYRQITAGVDIMSKDNLLKFNNINAKALLDLVPSRKLIDWIKETIFKKYVYESISIVENELTGDEILSYLLDIFCEAMLHLNFYRNTHDEFFLSPSDEKKKYAKYRKIFSLISKNFVEQFKADTKEIKDVNSLEHIYYRFRLVVDYISGMTDNYAKEIYQVLRGIK